ncbi:MAG: hypothetical protein U1E05_04095, partial [Patescibacteria group bacterium]|nr:hypothetical protein [Patescibacteria group bacterium]
YRGQVAVRMGAFKVVRQGLRTKSPGNWEVYHLANDPAEANDIAAEHPEIVRQAVEVLRRAVADNPTFPLSIPGVNAPATTP